MCWSLARPPRKPRPATAATAWLTAQGYDLTGLDSQVLSPYLKDGLGLLAFKLTKNSVMNA